MHKHELFVRMKNTDGTVSHLVPFMAKDHSSKETLDDLVNMIDEHVKDPKNTSPLQDAILYKIDGVCEYMISREFFLYPNTREWWSDGKSFGKDAKRKERFSRGQRGARSANTSSGRGNSRAT